LRTTGNIFLDECPHPSEKPVSPIPIKEAPVRRFFVFSMILLAGCARLPDRFESPRIVIKTEISGEKVGYLMTIDAGIRNDHPSIALFDYKGEFVFKADRAACRASKACSAGFSVPSIFPFETAPVHLELRGGDADFRPIFDLLELNRDEIVKSGGTEEIYLRSEDIRLVTLSYRREDIYRIIGEGRNEKDQ